MNKIYSTRTFEFNNFNTSKYFGLSFINNDKKHMRNLFKLVFADNDEKAKQLAEWNDNLLKPYKETKVDIVINGKAYPDSALIRVKTEYDTEKKQFTDNVLTKVFVKNEEQKDVTLTSLNELLQKSKSCSIIIRANGVNNYNNKVSIKYAIDTITIKN